MLLKSNYVTIYTGVCKNNVIIKALIEAQTSEGG